MAGKSSKTARAATRAGTKSNSKGFERPAGSNRFIPTAQGTRAYVFNDVGTTEHLKVDSAAFVAATAALLDGPAADVVVSQIGELHAAYPGAGWAAALDAANAGVNNDEAA